MKIAQMKEVGFPFTTNMRKPNDVDLVHRMWDVILVNQPLTMKIKPKNIRIAFWIVLGLSITFASLALSRPQPAIQETNATPTIMADSISATAEARGNLGSTDGIMLMAVVIVMIIIIPILLRRQTWANGKKKTKLKMPPEKE